MSSLTPWFVDVPAASGVYHLKRDPGAAPLGDVRHVVDPEPGPERVVVYEVVRLPESARVGRDREAADLDLVAHQPTAPRATTASTGTRRGRPARTAPEQVAAERQRQEHEPGVREDRDSRERPRARPRAAASDARRRAVSSPNMAAPSSWSRISRLPCRSCQTRYGLQRRDDGGRAARRAGEEAAADLETTIAVATATTIWAPPDRPPVPPRDPVDGIRNHAVERLRVRRRVPGT